MSNTCDPAAMLIVRTGKTKGTFLIEDAQQRHCGMYALLFLARAVRRGADMAKAKCPQCGRIPPEEAAYCPRCGSQIQATPATPWDIPAEAIEEIQVPLDEMRPAFANAVRVTLKGIAGERASGTWRVYSQVRQTFDIPLGEYTDFCDGGAYGRFALFLVDIDEEEGNVTFSVEKFPVEEGAGS